MTAGHPIATPRSTRTPPVALFVTPDLRSVATPGGMPKPYPVRDFFSNPEKAYFRLSEDGRTLGFMQPVSVDVTRNA